MGILLRLAALSRRLSLRAIGHEQRHQNGGHRGEDERRQRRRGTGPARAAQRPHVKSVQLVSKQTAFAQQSKLDPQADQQATGNRKLA